MNKNNLENFLESYVNGKEPEEILNEEIRERKPMNYWQNFENVKNEIQNIMKQLGYFPSKTELTKIGFGSLSTAIQKYHGGIKKIREIMGFKSERLEKGHWKNIENVKMAITDLETKLGRFPTISEISKNGYSGMVRAIIKEHGGYSAVRVIMGKRVIQKPDGYWKKWENVENVIQELAEILGHFPSEDDMRKSQYSTVANAIREHYGGMREVKKRMGEQKIKKPDGYWKNFDNIEKELGPIIKEMGKFPTHAELIQRGKSALSTAMRDYHGGFKTVKYKLGRDSEDKYGRYKSKEAVLEKLEEIWKNNPQLNRELPSDYWLRKNGYRYLGQSITAHHGGFQTFRVKLGKKNKRKPDGHWSNFENIKKVLSELEKQLGHFPSPNEIRNAGYGGMYSSIYREYRGIRAIKDKIGIKQKTKPRGYWKNFDNAIAELKKVVDEFGYFPTTRELERSGYHGLVNGIGKYHGGFTVFREKLQEYMGMPTKESHLESFLQEYVGGNDNYAK